MIPNTIQCMGQTYTVILVAFNDWKDGDDTAGVFDPDRNEVRIRKSVALDRMEQAFFHEMVHVILTALNHKLNHDEVFVDQFSGLLHQILKSSK